jgi:chaperonin cofactor prefoldin
MDAYFSKKEYNEMKRSLEKKILMLERKNQRLSNKIKELNKKDVARG